MSQPICSLISNSTPEHPLNLSDITHLSSLGLDSYSPDDRCFAWLVMLGLYPNSSTEWPSVNDTLHHTYWDLVQFSELSHWHSRVIPTHFPSEEFGLKSDRTMGVIHGDVVRTGRLAFFLPPRAIPGSVPLDANDSLHYIQEHLRRLERVLYVFATVNVGFGYMQGFNELVTPFYYVLLKSMYSLFEGEIDRVESLTFHFLQTPITKTRLAEFYTTQDKSSIILHGTQQFEDLLTKHLPKAANIIKTLNIHPLFYCLRWFTLLFAQDHDLPTLLMIWDALWAHFAELVEYLYCMAIGHIHAIEGKLTKESYAQTIGALQNLEIGPEIKAVLNFANQLWEENHKPTKRGWLMSVASAVMEFV
jgi:hypothetical protein